MLDPQLLRSEPEALADRLAIKRYVLDVDRLRSLDDQRKNLQTELQSLQAERNRSAKEVGRLKAAGGMQQTSSNKLPESLDASLRSKAILMEFARTLMRSFMGSPTSRTNRSPQEIVTPTTRKCIDGESQPHLTLSRQITSAWDQDLE